MPLPLCGWATKRRPVTASVAAVCQDPSTRTTAVLPVAPVVEALAAVGASMPTPVTVTSPSVTAAAAFAPERCP